jgi:hypothetical protein
MDLSITVNFPNCNVLLPADPIKDKKIKSNFKVDTSEKFYTGIIKNMFLTTGEICNHNWLLACYMYNNFITCADARLLSFDNGGFLSGIEHCAKINSADIVNINIKDTINIKSLVINKFNHCDILFNDNNKSLEMCNLIVSTLADDGVFITKILEPEYWEGSYMNTLLLYAILFNKTKIFRFPVCLCGQAYFSYYLIGTEKKKIIHFEKISRYFCAFPNDNYIINLDGIEIAEWKINLSNIKLHYMKKISNPASDIYSTINILKNII